MGVYGSCLPMLITGVSYKSRDEIYGAGEDRGGTPTEDRKTNELESMIYGIRKENEEF